MNSTIEGAPRLQNPPGEMPPGGVWCSASKINAGTLRTINSFSSKYSTKGTYLTAAVGAGESTLYVEDTSDFPVSGGGWIIDGTNDRDYFTYTDKTSALITGIPSTTGNAVLAHAAGALVIPAIKAIFIDDAVNEMRFIGDRGDTTIEELASIGIKQDGSDYIIGDFGSLNSGNSRIALRGRSYTGIGVVGSTYSGLAVKGEATGTGAGGTFSSTSGYGIVASGGISPLRLMPSGSASAPTHSAYLGALHVTSTGVLYICLGGTTWQKVGAQ